MMKAVDWFERRFLFALTRALFLLLILIAILVLCFGLKSFWNDYRQSMSSSPVSSKAVFAALDKNANSTSKDSFATVELNSNRSKGINSELKLSPLLKEFVQNQRDVFDFWLTELDVADRQAFVDGMASVLKAAFAKVSLNPQGKLSSADGEYVAEVINKYHEIELKRLRERDAAKSSFQQKYIFYAGGAAAFVALISLLSLVLVLLAIERNTRAAYLPNTLKRLE